MVMKNLYIFFKPIYELKPYKSGSQSQCPNQFCWPFEYEI